MVERKEITSILRINGLNVDMNALYITESFSYPLCDVPRNFLYVLCCKISPQSTMKKNGKLIALAVNLYIVAIELMRYFIDEGIYFTNKLSALFGYISGHNMFLFHVFKVNAYLPYLR